MKLGARASGPIGVFDSGIGGFSVLRVLQTQLPNEDFIFFGDQGHIPYGPRSLEEVRGFSEAIVRFLLAEGSKLIVVACNTASAAALVHLRKTFPDVPFVGMEPAVKPAAETTHSGVVGVIATKATFQGELYASVVERFAQDVIVLQATCPGLVEEIEAGRLEGEIAREILEIALRPMMMKGIDAVVLGCTHYPFVENLIRELVGDQVRIIEPSGAIARQVERLLDEHRLRNPNNQIGTTCYFTSGKAEVMEEAALQLMGVAVTAEGIGWESGEVSRG